MGDSKKIRTVRALVIGKSGSKSVKVAIDYKIKDPRYGKYVRRRTVLSVHDEHNKAGVGDKVKIAESRPYSKTKKWRLVDVSEKAVSQ